MIKVKINARWLKPRGCLHILFNRGLLMRRGFPIKSHTFPGFLRSRCLLDINQLKNRALAITAGHITDFLGAGQSGDCAIFNTNSSYFAAAVAARTCI